MSPVQGIPPRPQETLGADQGVPCAHLGGVDELHLDAHAAGHADVVLVDVDLCRGVRQAHAAGDVVGERMVLVVREPSVEIDAVALQRDHGPVGAELGDLGRRVPGRAGGELVTLHQHHVGPSLAREVIERGAPRDAAADHDGPGVGSHRLVVHTGPYSSIDTVTRPAAARWISARPAPNAGDAMRAGSPRPAPRRGSPPHVDPSGSEVCVPT